MSLPPPSLVLITSVAIAGCVPMSTLGSTSSGSSSSPASSPATSAAVSPRDARVDSSAKPRDEHRRVETAISEVLGTEARFSARAAHQQPSLCEGRADRVALSVWSYEARPAGLEIACFPVRRMDLDPRITFGSLREIQDRGALAKMISLARPSADGLAIAIRADALWIIEPGPSPTILRAPFKPGTKRGSLAEILLAYDTLIDREAIAVEVLARDEAEARTIDLASEQRRLAAKFDDAREARNRATRTREEAKLQAVWFPKAVGADVSLFALAKKYLATHEETTGIDPKRVKRIAITSRWDIRNGEYGEILGKVIDITVGFAREDGRCAFMTLQAQRDYAGRGEYHSQVQINGFMSGYTGISCKRLE